MAKYIKKAYKGISVNCKFTKSHYWDKSIFATLTEDTTYDIELTPYEGLTSEYTTNIGSIPTRVKINSGTLPNHTHYNGITGYLTTPPQNGHYLFPEYIYCNLNKQGTILLDESTGIGSNFSSSNYFTTNYKFLPENNPWVWQVKFKQTESFTGTVQYIMNSSHYSNAPYITILADNKINVSLTSNGNYIDGKSSDFTVEVGQDYWVRLEYDGNGIYSIKYSTDGQTYNLIGTIENSTTITATDVMWFGKTGHDTYLHGEIDFSETFIEINGKITWYAKDLYKTVINTYLFDEGEEQKGATKYNIFIKDSTTILSPSETKEGYMWSGDITVAKTTTGIKETLYANIIGDCQIIQNDGKNFTEKNYFISNKNFPYSGFFAHYVDIITRVTTGSDTNNRNIFWDESSNNHGFGTSSNNKWRIWNGSNVLGGSYEFNKPYWVRYRQEEPEVGTPYVALYYMLDDGTYNSYDELPEITDASWNLAIKIDNTVELFGNNPLRIGTGYTTPSEYWQGSIDLANTVIRTSTTDIHWRALEPCKIQPVPLEE